jgi:hypothetical protein
MAAMRGRLPLRGNQIAGHGVSREELSQLSSDGLRTLDVQEMAHAVDRALLDVRERAAEELGDPPTAAAFPRR